MTKQYVFANPTTNEVIGFNANSFQQAKIRMRKIAKILYNESHKDWEFIKTERKMKKWNGR